MTNKQYFQNIRNRLQKIDFELLRYIYPNQHFSISGHRINEDMDEIYDDCIRYFSTMKSHLNNIKNNEVGLDLDEEIKKGKII